MSRHTQNAPADRRELGIYSDCCGAPEFEMTRDDDKIDRVRVRR